MSAARWTRRPRSGVVLLSVLAIYACGAGCTQRAPEAGPPTASAPPTTTAVSTPLAAEAPTDGDLGAALPGPAQVGGIGGYTSCFSDEQLCYGEFLDSDPTLSWVKASDGAAPFGFGARWAWLQVRRPAQHQLVRRALSDARAMCRLGEWTDPGDPRGFSPRPPLEGNGKRFAVARAGFTGTRCAMEIGPPGGGGRYQSHHITAVRDDVVVRVDASSSRLVLQLFEEYVDRLVWPSSS